MVSRRIRTYGMKVIAGDLVNKKKGDVVEEENGEQCRDPKRSMLRIQKATTSMISSLLDVK